MNEDFFNITTIEQQSITADQAYHYKIIPKEVNGNSMKFYVDESVTNSSLVDELEMIFGLSIDLIPSNPEKIQRSLARYYRRQNGKSKRELSFNYNDDKDFLRKLISEAHEMGSSDIHLEPYEDKSRIRIRIDGKLVERYEVPLSDYAPMVNKIKIQSHLDIAEKRLPQDGRIEFRQGDLKFDIRVSVLPTLYGEKVVMRLLSRDATQIDLSKLGFEPEELKIFSEAIKKPNGVILISGPTGSGKTTTLYATLKLLNEESRNIVTIEDPIEYTLEGINQVQLKESIGLDFGAAMRTFLRQDPDIIMLGEIRDKDTAQMAIRAALTGHLVFSTIHTNSAWGTVTRLIDMGVPPFLIASTFNLSAAQRLVRKLCPSCKKKMNLESTSLPNGFKPKRALKEHYVAVGCEKCYYTGYQGRKAIYELIPIDTDLAESIKQEVSNVDEKLNQKGVKKLSDRAFELLEMGETSLEEVYSLLMH